MNYKVIKKVLNKSPKIHDNCYVSETASIIGDVTLSEDVNIWFGSVLRGDMNFIRVGSGTNIQDNTTIHVTTKTAPTEVGSGVTIGHNAIIHGCKIEDNCLIGMGSIIMDQVIIGNGTLIGAGSVVPQKMIIPPNSVVMGLPAKIIRKITKQERQEILERSKQYIELSKKYM
tara:strand:+ start:4641 stop:5156 length:516 start_codon:yes stop_codon:yes gene_type:complete